MLPPPDSPQQALDRAAKGDAESQVIAGVLCLTGTGVPQSDADAAAWFQKAAASNLPLGNYALGLLYYTGRGVPRDEPRPPTCSAAPPSRVSRPRAWRSAVST